VQDVIKKSRQANKDSLVMLLFLKKEIKYNYKNQKLTKLPPYLQVQETHHSTGSCM
jgi:hypothetical protein